MRVLHAPNGFVLPLVLGIVLVAALLAMHAAMESGATTLLATQRQLHQRTFELAERGIDAAMRQLQSADAPAGQQVLVSSENPSESSSVGIAVTAQTPLPAGFSAGRIVETSYEIRSTGHGPRGSGVTVVQGVRRLQRAASP